MPINSKQFWVIMLILCMNSSFKDNIHPGFPDGSKFSQGYNALIHRVHITTKWLSEHENNVSCVLCPQRLKYISQLGLSGALQPKTIIIKLQKMEFLMFFKNMFKNQAESSQSKGSQAVTVVTVCNREKDLNSMTKHSI